MRTAGILGRTAALCLAAAIGGCGGGDDSASLTVAIDGPTVRDFDAPELVLGGTASLPDGSIRTGGTPFDPGVSCQAGPYTLTWSNAATGQSGDVIALWNCTEFLLRWSIAVPLALGANPVTVTMTDALSSASDTVTVNRR